MSRSGSPVTARVCRLSDDLVAVHVACRPNGRVKTPPIAVHRRDDSGLPVRSLWLAGADGGTGAWLATIDGLTGPLDDLFLVLGNERTPLLAGSAAERVIGPKQLGASLRELGADDRRRGLEFLVTAPHQHGVVPSMTLSSRLAALSNAIREPLPDTKIQPDADCVVRLERVSVLDDRAFFLSGWIHDVAPERANLVVITPEGVRLQPSAGTVSFHERADVAKAFDASKLPSVGFHVFVELEHPSLHPEGWIVEVHSASGAAVQDVARSPAKPDHAAVRHRMLDPLRSTTVSDLVIEHQVMPALERLRAADPARIDELLEYGPVADAPDVTIVIATTRADLIAHQLLGLAGPSRPDQVELLFVVAPSAAAAIQRQATELSELYGVGFRVAVLSRNAGRATALNLAATVARGRLLVLMRDDVVAGTPAWIAELQRFHDLHDAAAVGPKLVFEDGAIAQLGIAYERAADGRFESTFPLRGLSADVAGAVDARPVQALPEGCVMVDAERLRSAGGLCESYLGGGDELADLCLSLTAAGLEVWCVAPVQLTFLDIGGWPTRASPATMRLNNWLFERRFGERLTDGAAPERSADGAADRSPAPLRVDEVVLAPWREWVRDASLLHPGPDSELGAYDQTFSLAFEGWAVATDGREMTVEVLCDGARLAAAPVSIARRDVAERLAGVPGAAAAGFDAVISTIGLPTDFALELELVADDGERSPLATVRGRRHAIHSGYRARFAPLLLTTLGRTGSSWLELLVAQHPEIVACHPFIHDARLVSYWTQVLQTFADPASYLQILRPELYPGLWWTGAARPGRLPLRMAETRTASWLGREHVQAVAGFCQARIDAFYGELALASHRHAARYFAEKCWPDEVTPRLAAELYPDHREILLVRDFRDMVCSIFQFNAKRGVASFGRELADSDEQFISDLRAGALRMLSAWRSRGERAHLMRYEDLIEAPERTLAAAFSYLGVADDATTIKRVLADAAARLPEAQRAHRTADDPAASIGRWRRELSAEHRALCGEAFDDVLEQFGYEPTAAEPRAAAV